MSPDALSDEELERLRTGANMTVLDHRQANWPESYSANMTLRFLATIDLLRARAESAETRTQMQDSDFEVHNRTQIEVTATQHDEILALLERAERAEAETAQFRAREAEAVETMQDFQRVLYEQVERVREECEKYGLPGQNLDVLLRHIYANRDMVYAAKDLLAEALRERADLAEQRLADAVELLRDVAPEDEAVIDFLASLAPQGENDD